MGTRKNISSLHVPHNKHTAASVPTPIETPKKVVLPLNVTGSSSNESAACVAVGDYVRVGQVIATEKGRFSDIIHAPVSGTVTEVGPVFFDTDKPVEGIVIESDGKMELSPDIKKPEISNCDEFLEAVKASGAVGLGGAAFPTWAKLKEATNPDYKVDTVLINAAECEPYITSDHRMMLAHPELISDGIEYMRTYMSEYLGNAKFMICIEDNKPDAIEVLEKTFEGRDYVEIKKLTAIYPQGAKQVMLYNATGRVAVAGRRFPSFGALIINVSTLAKLAEYLNTGMPLVDRIVTVDGTAVATPKNLIAPVGTMVSELLKYVELKKGAKIGKVIIGGPMNGTSVYSIDTPISKVGNAVLLFDEKDSVLPEPTACIHCGRCNEKCPVNINVVDVERAFKRKNEEEREREIIQTGVRQCVDCGCCSYVCPAHRPLLSINREAIAWAKNYAWEKKEGGKK